MLPLSLLRAAANSPMLVELKSGDTYNGRLVNCDAWMNLNLRDVICTSKDGDRFWKMPECYIRGSSVKYLRLPEEAIDQVPEDDGRKHQGYRRGGNNNDGGRGRGGRSGRTGGRGRGRGRGGGRSSGRDGGRSGGRGGGRGGRSTGGGRNYSQS
uniref:U6 snRNA-associated Sm-like protein LSm4 n=1 Tax=Eucampia antarctica TaxID=49252 RepID=A0A7S2RDC5_9STRA|mmetsp:Transcript_20110/g.19350  ORF Transcript_20110/g.19350 Transcript_20110/m.19350 type:complete len:154 (+) Transcript_20110:105-566(+)